MSSEISPSFKGAPLLALALDSATAPQPPWDFYYLSLTEGGCGLLSKNALNSDMSLILCSWPFASDQALPAIPREYHHFIRREGRSRQNRTLCSHLDLRTISLLVEWDFWLSLGQNWLLLWTPQISFRVVFQDELFWFLGKVLHGP